MVPVPHISAQSYPAPAVAVAIMIWAIQKNKAKWYPDHESWHK
jgi:hypothetical protein